MRGGDDLLLNPHSPPPHTQTDGLPVRTLRSTHRRVYVWGGKYQLVMLGEEGETGPRAMCVCEQGFSYYCIAHIRVNVVRVNVAFGFLSHSG